MSKFIVHYFHGSDFGESIRHLLCFWNQDFEDRRYTLETWAEFKSKTPFGQLPVLEIDGKQYAQSIAICRYLGTKCGLAGKNAEEAFEIDQNIDFVSDICARVAASVYESDKAANVKRQEENLKNVHVLLEKLNALIKKNNGHLALGKLTWGDFLLPDMFDNLKVIMQCPDLEEKYPSIKNLYNQIGLIHIEEEEEEEKEGEGRK